MKKFALSLLVVVAIALTGCLVISVYPFYTPKDVVFESGLIGSWTNRTEANERWIFAKENTNAYRLTYVSGDKTNVMQAHLFKLKGQAFLDLFTAEQKDGIFPPPIPSHLLMRVFELSPTLRMAPLGYEWLAGVLEKKPKVLRHHVVSGSNNKDDQGFVLTADTDELQRFVLKHLQTKEAWTNQSELRLDTAVAPPAAETKK